MTTTIEDLWPADFSMDDQIPPVTILRQQATLLGRKTRNFVEGDIVTEATATGAFKHTFFLIAPVLDDYRYCLFYIHHEIIYYPLTLFDCGGTGKLCHDESEFLAALRDVLTAESTRKVISALIAQSKA